MFHTGTLFLRLRKRSANIVTFFNVLSLLHTSRSAEKDPSFWIKMQKKNIHKFVRYIYGIPFYRERFDRAGLGPGDITEPEDFLKLPPLTREEYRRWMDEEYRKNPRRYREYLKASTSGSSAEPLILYKYPEDNAVDIANLYRTVLIQPGHRYPLLSGKTMGMMVSESNTRSIIQRLGFFRTRQCLAVRPAEKLYHSFAEFEPDFLYGMKPAILDLAIYMLDNRVKPKKQLYVATIGAILSADERKTIESVFGSHSLFDMYGATEVGNFAHERTGYPHHYEIWHDTHVVNVVDEEGKSVREGTGRILITHLLHHAFPIVNYQLNDYVEIAEENGVPYLVTIAGRENDRILNADGTYFSWLVIDKVTKELPGVLYCQVRQTDYDKLDFYLVSGNGQDHFEETEKLLQDRCEKHFRTNPKKILFHWTNHIPVDMNGKRKLVVSEVSPFV